MATYFIDRKKARALEVLFLMLGRPLCIRSISTLEQNLHLLEVILQASINKEMEAKAKAKAKAKKEDEKGKKDETIMMASSSSLPETYGPNKVESNVLQHLPSILGRKGLSTRAYR